MDGVAASSPSYSFLAVLMVLACVAFIVCWMTVVVWSFITNLRASIASRRGSGVAASDRGLGGTASRSGSMRTAVAVATSPSNFVPASGSGECTTGTKQVVMESVASSVLAPWGQAFVPHDTDRSVTSSVWN